MEADLGVPPSRRRARRTISKKVAANGLSSARDTYIRHLPTKHQFLFPHRARKGVRKKLAATTCKLFPQQSLGPAWVECGQHVSQMWINSA